MEPGSRAGRVDRRGFLVAGAAAAAGGWSLLRVEGAAAKRGDLAALARAVRGPVLTPGSSRYGRARVVFDERFDGRRPRAVVQPLDARDVKAVVRWAQARGERLAARSGGHSYAGYSCPDGGVVVDVRRLHGIHVDGAHVSAGAGVRLIDLHRSLAPLGLTLPTGSCPTVGLAGLALGGGIGLEARELGLTCDRVSAIDVVTGEGRSLTATARDHRDLFWALRGGGGGNFGIATRFSLRAARAGPASWFQISWPWSNADAALKAWDAFAPEADARLSSVCTIGEGRISALGQFSGTEPALRRLLSPLAAVSGARLRTGTSSRLDLVYRWAGCLGHSQTCGAGRASFGAASGYVDRRLGSDARAALLALAESPHGTLLLDAAGGAIARVPSHATAFIHRGQRASVQAYATVARGDEAKAHAWLRSARTVLARHGSGQAYQNYIDPDLHGWAKAYYGANLPRLKAVRRAYDPDGIFAFAQGVGT